MNRIRYALIMAAGRGTRMLPLTKDLPKAMAPYDGSTLIARGIARVKNYLPNIYVTVGYKGPLLAEHVVAQGITGIFDTSGRDNAWWIFNTLMCKLDEPIFVLTCDNVTVLDFFSIEKDYHDQGSPQCMVIPVKPVAGLEGDFVHHEKNLVSKISRTDVADLYLSGIQILNPRKIAESIVPCNNFMEVWAALISMRKLICSSVIPSKWYAADSVEQLAKIPAGY